MKKYGQCETDAVSFNELLINLYPYYSFAVSIASSSNISMLSSTNHVCHSETTEVILFADHNGLGLTLSGGIFSSVPLTEPPIISILEPRSAAAK